MANVTTETIMRRILGRAKEAENGGVETPPHRTRAKGVTTLAADNGGTAGGTSYEEAARIVQTLIDGGRAKRVEELEVLRTVPEGGVTLPVVADGTLKTMNTDTIMEQLNRNFAKELDKLVVGQVPVITDPEIDEITQIDIGGDCPKTIAT